MRYNVPQNEGSAKLEKYLNESIEDINGRIEQGGMTTDPIYHHNIMAIYIGIDFIQALSVNIINNDSNEYKIADLENYLTKNGFTTTNIYPAGGVYKDYQQSAGIITGIHMFNGTELEVTVILDGAVTARTISFSDITDTVNIIRGDDN
jgi:hypothetical protein